MDEKSKFEAVDPRLEKNSRNKIAA